jgi:hypothetical protein
VPLDLRGLRRRFIEDRAGIEAPLAPPAPRLIPGPVVQERAQEPTLDVGDDRTGQVAVGVAPASRILSPHRVLRPPVHASEDGGSSVDHEVFLVEPALEPTPGPVEQLTEPVAPPEVDAEVPERRVVADDLCAG